MAAREAAKVEFTTWYPGYNAQNCNLLYNPAILDRRERCGGQNCPECSIPIIEDKIGCVLLETTGRRVG